MDGQKRSKTHQRENDNRKYRRRVCLQHAHRVQRTSQRGNSIVFESFSVDSRKRIKTVLGVDAKRSTIFDENENVLVWTGP